MSDYFLFYKPYGVLSQFTSEAGKKTLKDFTDVQRDVYPVGRLDHDSEGLLLLTNDKSINNRLLHPSNRHEREYWVEVEGIPDSQAINQLEEGVEVTIDGERYKTKNCVAQLFSAPPSVPDRDPPVRFRKNIPTSWIRLILHEGKNRQVRKMTAATGFPTLRLIRYRVEKLSIEGLQPGDIRTLTQSETYAALFEHKRG
ncbi:MAG TPA: pseudouridine synthase [Flavitalea sp.]|nr:pseudouridine synthase [Flavitalea sp.]